MNKTMLLALLLGGCATDEPLSTDETTEAVQGGTVEGDFRYPWVVNVASGLSCHGVLIAPSWVLTAAHCVDSSNVPRASYNRIDPYTGAAHSGSRSAINNPSSRVYIHPDYSVGSGEHDIALFQLTSAFTLDRYIQTVALPTAAAAIGDVGTIASYIHHNGTLSTGQVAIMRASVLADSACGGFPSDLCAAAAATGACTGDSGSSLVRTSTGRATTLGVASRVTPGCNDATLGLPLTLADVYAHRTWIAQTTGISLSEFAGTSRLQWSGQPTDGTMTLACESSPFGTTTKTVSGPMNAPGAEVRISCAVGQRVRATCQLDSKTYGVLDGFLLTTTSQTTGASSTTSLSFGSTRATYASGYDSGVSPIRQFRCNASPVTTRL